MPNHPGPFYVHEKLAAAREQDLSRRVRVHQALATVPRPPHIVGRVRGTVAAFLRKLADRLEPGRSTAQVPQPGR